MLPNATITQFRDWWLNGALMEWQWRGKTEALLVKACRSAILSTTNLIWTCLGRNPGFQGGRPNRLTAWTMARLARTRCISYNTC